MNTDHLSSVSTGKLELTSSFENGELLVKKSYLEEIKPLSKSYKLGDSGSEVTKIKEWLMLWQLNSNYVANIVDLKNGNDFDTQFDANTEQVTKTIQSFLNLTATGVVDEETWQSLVHPLKESLSLYAYNKTSLNEKMVYFATKHAQFHAAELESDNLGPGVRSYMDGYDGEQWYWCQGFACTILDQTFSSIGKDFTQYYPNTLACETFREAARKNSLLVTHEELVAKTYIPKSGDLVLYISTSSAEAHHTEIVYEVLDPEKGCMLTIGGNTNFSGSRNGVGVFFVDRNFLDADVEIVKLEAE